jgi:hypothetical protein
LDIKGLSCRRRNTNNRILSWMTRLGSTRTSSQLMDNSLLLQHRTKTNNWVLPRRILQQQTPTNRQKMAQHFSLDEWVKKKFSKEERTILHPALGAFIASIIFFHLCSYAAIEWCEKQGDYSSPLYTLSVILAIASAVGGAAALIVINRTIEKLHENKN